MEGRAPQRTLAIANIRPRWILAGVRGDLAYRSLRSLGQVTLLLASLLLGFVVGRLASVSALRSGYASLAAAPAAGIQSRPIAIDSLAITPARGHVVLGERSPSRLASV